jgi:hypothetical protein
MNLEPFPHGGVPVCYSTNKRIRGGTVDKHVARQCDNRENRCDGVTVRKWNLRVREACNDSAREHWFLYGKTVDDIELILGTEIHQSRKVPKDKPYNNWVEKYKIARKLTKMNTWTQTLYMHLYPRRHSPHDQDGQCKRLDVQLA